MVVVRMMMTANKVAIDNMNDELNNWQVKNES
jgi:hypothetical protein